MGAHICSKCGTQLTNEERRCDSCRADDDWKAKVEDRIEALEEYTGNYAVYFSGLECRVEELEKLVEDHDVRMEEADDVTSEGKKPQADIVETLREDADELDEIAQVGRSYHGSYKYSEEWHEGYETAVNLALPKGKDLRCAADEIERLDHDRAAAIEAHMEATAEIERLRKDVTDLAKRYGWDPGSKHYSSDPVVHLGQEIEWLRKARAEARKEASRLMKEKHNLRRRLDAMLAAAKGESDV